MLFNPGDTGGIAGHDLKHVKRLQEPEMKVPESFVLDAFIHNTYTLQNRP